MFLFYILLPTFIGPLEYGKFAYAFAICAIIVQPVVEMGLDMVLVKWVSRGNVDEVKKFYLSE
jgi:O-antigen/teichoic acid export membrane protein